MNILCLLYNQQKAAEESERRDEKILHQRLRRFSAENVFGVGGGRYGKENCKRRKQVRHSKNVARTVFLSPFWRTAINGTHDLYNIVQA